MNLTRRGKTGGRHIKPRFQDTSYLICSNFLCILLRQLDDLNQHEVQKKAVQKAVKSQVKQRGMKYDNEVSLCFFPRVDTLLLYAWWLIFCKDHQAVSQVVSWPWSKCSPTAQLSTSPVTWGVFLPSLSLYHDRPLIPLFSVPGAPGMGKGAQAGRILTHTESGQPQAKDRQYQTTRTVANWRTGTFQDVHRDTVDANIQTHPTGTIGDKSMFQPATDMHIAESTLGCAALTNCVLCGMAQAVLSPVPSLRGTLFQATWTWL